MPIGRTAMVLGLAAIGVLGTMAPLLPYHLPQVTGLPGDWLLNSNQYAFHFSDGFGKCTRGRYDALFNFAGNIGRMRADGTGKRIIIRHADIGEFAVSQDGKRIVYVQTDNGAYNLYMADGEGKHIRRLTDTAIREAHPSFSPNGLTIVYSAISRDGFRKAQIMLLDIDSGSTINLSRKIGAGIEPSFGHDGNYILWMIDGHIFRAKLDGSDKRQLTFGRNRSRAALADDHGPVASPDGHLIAFTRVQGYLENNRNETPEDIDGPHKTVSVWVMNADGSNPHPVTKPVASTLEQDSGVFAPTGIWVGYRRVETINGSPRNTLWERDLQTWEEHAVFDDEFYLGISYTGWLR